MEIALTLTEQIEKWGAKGWVEPMIEELGPWLLLQLGDVANLLEELLKYVFIHVIQYKLLGTPLF